MDNGLPVLICTLEYGLDLDFFLQVINITNLIDWIITRIFNIPEYLVIFPLQKRVFFFITENSVPYFFHYVHLTDLVFLAEDLSVRVTTAETSDFV